MIVINNLDREKEIYEQMDGFAVAVNRIRPKPEDFVYKYSECDGRQKAFLRGMAHAADVVDTFWENRDVMEGTNEPEVIKKLREEYQEDALANLQDWIISEMASYLISFGDDNASREE